MGLIVSGFFLLSAWVVEARAAELADRPGKSQAGLLRITGSSTMCPMISAINERFRTVKPDIRLVVECGGSERGIKDVREGNAEIGMIARALKADEKDLYGFPIARDGLSFIAHKSNPVPTLSPEQIAGIFSGKIISWRQVGGNDAPITVILKEKGKVATEFLVKHFDLAGKLQGKVVPGDNPETAGMVLSNPNAIGYLSSGEAERRANAGEALRTIPLGGVAPTARNIITGNYPLTRPLTLITRGLPSGLEKEFVNYCLSSKVVDLIEKFDFVPYED